MVKHIANYQEFVKVSAMRINLNRCLRAGWLAVLVVTQVGLVAAAKDTPPKKPNIVFILADDLGYGDVACYGCPDTRTPNIDRLAREGIKMTSYYSNAPECSPTRTAFLTGRYQHRVGGLECAIGNGNVGRYDDAIRLRDSHDLGLPASEITLARILKSAGYATAIAGKWHLGYEPKFLPEQHGFDTWFGPIGGGADYFFHTEPEGLSALYRNGKPVQSEGYTTDLITREAVEKVHQLAGKPFFLYVAYTAPHTPLQDPASRPEKALGDADWNKGTRETYAKIVERLDQGVGKILEELDARGLRDNTLVVFTSDNGGTKIGRNAPYSGNKGGLFEGGIRVPCVIRWPGKLPAGKVSEQIGITMDFARSFVRIADASQPSGRTWDGIDLLSKLEHNDPVEPRTLFWRIRRGENTWRAVREGNLKYVSKQEGRKMQEYLFDLGSDILEKNNLLTNKADETLRLKTLLAGWEKEVKPNR
jgi:N-acetylgalactosamine-6-sulfatase